MADVEIDHEVFRHFALPRSSPVGELLGVGQVVMAVHGYLNFVLVGEGRHLFRRADGGTGGDHFHVHRLGHLEAAIDFGVGKTIVEAEIVGVQFDAGIVPLMADLGEGVERGFQAPLA